MTKRSRTEAQDAELRQLREMNRALRRVIDREARTRRIMDAAVEIRMEREMNRKRR